MVFIVAVNFVLFMAPLHLGLFVGSRYNRAHKRKGSSPMTRAQGALSVSGVVGEVVLCVLGRISVVVNLGYH